MTCPRKKPFFNDIAGESSVRVSNKAKAWVGKGMSLFALASRQPAGSCVLLLSAHVLIRIQADVQISLNKT